MNVMLLGGPLDHAIRDVPAEYEIPREAYIAECRRPQFETIRYERRRVCVEQPNPLHWWVYVSPGHHPTPAELTDAMPDNVRRLL